LLSLILRILFDARVASHVGAALAGHPEHAAKLIKICEREAPHCQLRGVHENDRWMEKTLGIGNGTRGVHGMVYAFAAPYLPKFLQISWLLDVPLVSAFAAARRISGPRCRLVRDCRKWMK